MRANATLREPELQKFWFDNGIDFELGLKNKGTNFTLHDGPPYANGTLHMGHALNKILKDIINKYQILRGRKVRFIPGWDCHGLPIELKVLQKLKRKEREELTPIQLRKKAAEYASEQISSQKEGFRRWGIWGDWGNPYLTLQKTYEAAQIKLFGEMALKGYIYRGLKPVHWSPSSRTALAEAELEYPEGHTSPSVYVAFPVVKISEPLYKSLASQGLNLPLDQAELSQKVKVAIWTTTPWTLPANAAVAVNQNIEYVLAQDSTDQLLILASDLLQDISEEIGSSLEKIASVKGAMFEGCFYKNPLLEKISPFVIGGSYITTQSGTGIVHTAPGHGLDDFNTGIKYDLPVICPVNSKGIFTAEAGKYEGLNVLKDANDEIIKDLKISGLLLKERPYVHKYPYDWRTKKPTIFRATEQWFASVEGFRKQALNSIEEVEWLPASGEKRIKAMVNDRGDWCISRQRTWGVPIPVFYSKDGDDVLLNKSTIDHIEQLIKKHGADIWWELDVSKLLPSHYSEQSDQWIKGTDTMDVWFDSGSSWSAVTFKHEDLNYPADLYLEGTDQHRGWFQSSLLTSVAVTSQAPYKKVLTHGFALDENGRKMSKSLGNIVDPLVIINGGNNKKLDPPFGADVLRLWVSSVDYSVDVPIGSNILRQLSDVYRKVRNTARYLLGNLHDFDPSKYSLDVHDLSILDRWMLNRTAEVFDEITNAFESYDFIKFFQLLQTFCVVDLSNFYLDIAKDRLYVSAPSDSRRRSCQYVLSLIIEKLAGIIAPVLCHMAEDIWQNIPYSLEEKSVFQRGWPNLPDAWRDNSLNEPINHIRELRASVNRGLEDCRNKQEIGSSLESSVRIVPKSDTLKETLSFIQENGDLEVDNIHDLLLVSKVQIGGEPWAEVLFCKEEEMAIIEISKSRGSKCARCWHYESDIGKHANHPLLCSRCVETLNRII
ncbi:Isoleucyl-tRNA synthetase [Prochlorococcus sp. MIT 0602]|nr:Isoleucyl-tRNA synthetase [Prochlorococcus sp. MIT 0602]